MINGFSVESEKRAPAAECNLIRSCLRQGDREKKQSWPGWVEMEDVLHAGGQTSLDWHWRGRSHISPPTFPEQGGKEHPTGLRIFRS